MFFKDKMIDSKKKEQCIDDNGSITQDDERTLNWLINQCISSNAGCYFSEFNHSHYNSYQKTTVAYKYYFGKKSHGIDIYMDLPLSMGTKENLSKCSSEIVPS